MSSNPPAPAGKLELTEILQDIPEVLNLANVIQANVAAMPPVAQRKAVDWAKCFGAAEGQPLMMLAMLIDKVSEQAKS